MSALEDAVRAAFVRATDEAYGCVTSFRDGEFFVIGEGALRTRMYTGDRSGRCCFLYTVFPWQGPDEKSSFYFAGPGTEDRLRQQLDLWADRSPPFLVAYVRRSLASLVDAVGQRAAEDAMAEAVVQSVMDG